MSKDDIDVIVYKILKYMYECMKAGKEPELSDICYDKQSVYGRVIDNDIPVDYIQFETMVEMAKEEGVDFIELR